MNKSLTQQNDRQVGYWLLTGVAMIMIQVLLGGITRLTESGLSITEWKPVIKILPPLNETAWQEEFAKYRQTDQFKYIHADFTLSDFKFIFFWEWFHRLWAQLLGFVFLIGFFYFLAKRKLRKPMVLPLIILFFLGGVQGVIGKIMVESGLVPEMYFVGHVELATHFVSALILLVYTLWFALQLIVPEQQIIYDKKLFRFTLILLILLFVQFAYGGFMAGLRAATSAATWPTINGEWLPASLFKEAGGSNYFNNPFMVQFIHRALAYILTILLVVWFLKAKRTVVSAWLAKTRSLPLLLVFLQVVLGICTVVYSPSATALVWFGVLHQFTAMLLMTSLVWVLYLLKQK